MSAVVRQVVLHLGLPKTATTSLQTRLFPIFPGYLGKFYQGDHQYPSPALRHLIEVLRDDGTTDPEKVSKFRRDASWSEPLELWIEELLAVEEETLVVSEEDFSIWRSPDGNAARWPVVDARGARPRRGPHPITGFLERLRELLPVDVELKTILTLRNQCDFLGSLAAEMGILKKGFISRRLDENDGFLNFYALTRDLENLRGRENHLTLFFESGWEHNTQEILSFVSCSSVEMNDQNPAQTQKNVLRTDRGWLVNRLTILDRLERWLRSAVHRFPRLESHLYASETITRAVRLLSNPELRNRALGWISFRDPHVVLTDEERLRIRAHCAESNAQLSEHLGVDLRAFGY